MNISLVLNYLYPGAQWILTGETYSGLEWLDDSPKPTEKQLKDAEPMAIYHAEYESVKRARHAAYIAPDGSDALFMKYQRDEDGVTKQAWLDRVAEINAAHPYPEPPKVKK
jgi:hypothetical protein